MLFFAQIKALIRMRRMHYLGRLSDIPILAYLIVRFGLVDLVGEGVSIILRFAAILCGDHLSYACVLDRIIGACNRNCKNL